MSKSLLKINNNTLSLTDSINIPDDDTIRVISILGKARMGKSTFLNAIAKHLNSANPPPFATQNDDDHCTRGVDYYYDELSHTLLLDCQGLALEDSSSDPLLLLAIYLISDTIVFNERMMLQNTALKLLEPICLFTQYMDLEDIPKPVLVFRISDADLVKNPESNLYKVMTRYNDQYQSIRDTIINLFQNPLRIVKTDTIDKNTKTSIDDGNYNTILSNHKLGFQTAIESICSTLSNTKPASVWKALLHKIVDSVNSNQKIKAEMLDVVSMIANHEMLDWEQKLKVAQPQLFMDIQVDGLQKTYIETVEPRIISVRNVLAQFKTKFQNLPIGLKSTYYMGLEQRLTNPIENAKKISAQLAESAIAPVLIEAQRNRVITFTNKESAFLNTTIILAEFTLLRDTVSKYHESVAKKYIDWLNNQEDTLKNAVEHVKVVERQGRMFISCKCQNAIKTFCTEALSIVNMNIVNKSQETEAIVSMNIKDLLTNLRKTTQENMLNMLTHNPIVIEITFVDTILSIAINTQSETIIPATHNLVKDIYDEFCASMTKYEELYIDLMSAKFRKDGEDNETYIKRLEKELATIKSEIMRINDKWDTLQQSNKTENTKDDSSTMVRVISDMRNFMDSIPEALVLEPIKSAPVVNLKCCGWWKN